MKDLKCFIYEKYLINKSTIINKYDINNPNYVCKTRSELKNIDELITDDVIDNVYKLYKEDDILLVWKINSIDIENESNQNQYNEIVKINRKNHNVRFDGKDCDFEMKQNNNIMLLIFRSKHTKEIVELYIIFKNNKHIKYYYYIIKNN